MLIKLFPENPNPKRIYKIVETLHNDGVIVFPTDTVYALGCDIMNPRAVERVAKIKGIKLEKANFSFLCYDLSHLSDYTKFVDNSIFKLMKKNIPGPFTFILHASNNVPKIFRNKKKTIGLRVPDNPITLEIIKELGNPLLSTSIHDDDEILEYMTDPELIHDKYRSSVDVVINGGYGKNEPSTIINCTNQEPEIIRQGIGEIVF